MTSLVEPNVAIVSLAKGLELGTLLRPSQILGQVLTDHDPSLLGVLSGPNLAHEIAAGEPSATVVAVPDPTWCRRLQTVLMTNRFRVYTSTDVVGCEIGGAVKNVIAIAVGMADGLGYGWNTKAALITRGLAELARLGVALGGEPLTFLGLAGNGDLIATCSSPQSRNRRVGFELGQGRALADILADTNTVAEGVTSAPAVLALAGSVDVELPIASQVQAVLMGTHSPATVAEALMDRAQTTELHDLSDPAEVHADRLVDGTPVRVRPIQPSDASALDQFHQELSDHTTRMRFFTVHPHLSSVEMTRFTTVDHHNREALVMLARDEIIAVGRYDREPGSAQAEVAFVVSDAWQSHGAATALLLNLADRARREGVVLFVADTLCENHEMLRVFQNTGSVTSAKMQSGVTHVTMTLERLQGVGASSCVAP